MAQQVLRVNQTFPAGTTVFAYPLAYPGAQAPDAVPPGASVTSAVVQTDGTLTFTGLNDDTRYWAYAQISGDDRTIGFRTDPASSSGTAVKTVERTFTETATAGVYTASVDLPAGATLIDVIVNGVALWDTATSATLKVGDATDDDGYYTAVNLKATDLLAGESLSFGNAGGKAGAYIANSQVSPRYSAAVRTISGVVTTVGSGTAGRTRMTVIYSAPGTADITAATKV